MQRVAATFSNASKKMPTSMPSIERPHRDGTWRNDMALMAAATHASKAKAEKRQKHVGRATPGGKIVVRVRRVDPDVESLEREHRRCTWIPGQKQIRPTPEVRLKDASTTQLLRTWRSLEDAAHARIFGGADRVRPHHLLRTTALPRRANSGHHLLRAGLAYPVEPGTEHWVLWFVSAGLESDGRLTTAPWRAPSRSNSRRCVLPSAPRRSRRSLVSEREAQPASQPTRASFLAGPTVRLVPCECLFGWMRARRTRQAREDASSAMRSIGKCAQCA